MYSILKPPQIIKIIVHSLVSQTLWKLVVKIHQGGQYLGEKTKRGTFYYNFHQKLRQTINKMRISIIVAVSTNGAIGKDNQLLWRLPDDLKRFKSLTLGHPMIMGRKTYESIGKPLPGRTSIVITRNPDYNQDGVIIASSLEDGLEKARLTGTPETFIIGGGNIYRQALPFADKIYLTEVHTEIGGDTFFNLTNPAAWEEDIRIKHPADDRHAYSFDFVDLSLK